MIQLTGKFKAQKRVGNYSSDVLKQVWDNLD